jgi:hypothetical protein
VAISYGKNVIAGIYEIPSLGWEKAWQLYLYSDVIASEAWQSHKKEYFINILKRLPHFLWSLAMTTCL